MSLIEIVIVELLNPVDLTSNEPLVGLGTKLNCAEVISGIQTSHPYSKILLTFFSPSGVMGTRDQNIADYVTYLPLDTKSNAQGFLNLVNPKLILFSRSDLWYNFLYLLRNKPKLAPFLPFFLLLLPFKRHRP